MKKIFSIAAITFATTTFILMSTVISFAADNAASVTRVGNDVLVSAAYVQKIDGYDANKPVYVAYNDNGWAVSGIAAWNASPVEAKKQADGSCIAPNMAGKRFNLFQLKSQAFLPDPYVPSNIGWVMIHDANSNYAKADGVDNSHSNGPCFLVK